MSAPTDDAASQTADLGDERMPILYVAPWVDYGGTAKGTLDWFKWLDHTRFRASLITTQAPSANRLLGDVERYAEEVWHLPDLIPGGQMPDFILDFVQSRGIRVVHIMNARLGFEMLPDLRCLPNPPVIVVQLHVEEDTRGGYVRYVTTRYGNLVDAFSVTSQHLADTMVADYDVDPGKCHIIYTGVDADEEFNPDAVEPLPELRDDRIEILFIGRLVAQKDPRLMVDVAERLRQEVSNFRINVVGYGKLEPKVRELVAERDLGSHVEFRGPTAEPARWFASCDLLLMTSAFEGIPYVLFEAMAMGVPAVVPALPGMTELMPEGVGGRLISPRDDVDAYTAALTSLISDVRERRRIGSAARAYVRSRFQLSQMARAHENLYRELVGGRTEIDRLGVILSQPQQRHPAAPGARR